MYLKQMTTIYPAKAYISLDYLSGVKTTLRFVIDLEVAAEV